MNQQKIGYVCAVVGMSLSSAHAGECTPVVTSMKASARAVYQATLTRTDSRRNVTRTSVIQTGSVQYVETSGKWVAMEIASKNLVDAVSETEKNSQMKCRALGTAQLNDHPTKVYSVHMTTDMLPSDGKIWIGADDLPLRIERKVDGVTYLTDYEYGPVDPPVNNAIAAKK